MNIQFDRFSISSWHVLSAFPCTRAVGNLWRISLSVNIVYQLPFFVYYSIILLGFSFLTIAFLIPAFPELTITRIAWFTNCLFLAWLALYSLLLKNDGFWYPK